MRVEKAFTQFPNLETKRLHLRQLQPSDAEALFAMKSDVDVTSASGQEPHRTLDDTHKWLERLRLSYENRESLYWCMTLKGDDTAIGAAPLWNFDAHYRCGEIGYELHPAYWRQGIMTEAMLEIIRYSFAAFGLNRIEATPFDNNPSSKKLLLKLGFSYEGKLRQRHFFGGVYIDQLYYGLLKEDWLKFEQEAK